MIAVCDPSKTYVLTVLLTLSILPVPENLSKQPNAALNHRYRASVEGFWFMQ